MINLNTRREETLNEGNQNNGDEITKI